MSTGIGAAPMASPRTRPATGRKASTAAPALGPANRASSCRADRAVVSMSRCTASKTSAKGMPCRADNAHDVASRPNMRSTCSIPGPQAARTSGSAVGTPLDRADAASPRSRSANGRGASLATCSTAVTGWAPARSSVTTPRSSDGDHRRRRPSFAHVPGPFGAIRPPPRAVRIPPWHPYRRSGHNRPSRTRRKRSGNVGGVPSTVPFPRRPDARWETRWVGGVGRVAVPRRAMATAVNRSRTPSSRRSARRHPAAWCSGVPS